MTELGIDQKNRFLKHKQHDHVHNQKKSTYRIMEVFGTCIESLIMIPAASNLRLFKFELVNFGAPGEGRFFLALVFPNIRAILS